MTPLKDDSNGDVKYPVDREWLIFQCTLNVQIKENDWEQ